MKLVIRAFALTVVLAGAAAATVSSSPSPRIASSHLLSGPGFPIPACGPGVPTCPKSTQK